MGGQGGPAPPPLEYPYGGHPCFWPLLKSVRSQLSDAHHEQQKAHLAALETIVDTIRFLTMQGLALQGHCQTDGNFYQLLRLRSNDIPQLRDWIQRRDNWLGHEVQNEIIDMFCSKIQSELAKSIVSTEFFSVMADGTQDITGQEQLSVLYRVVSPDFEVTDYFMGFYALPSSTGECCSCCFDRCGNQNGNRLTKMSWTRI